MKNHAAIICGLFYTQHNVICGVYPLNQQQHHQQKQPTGIFSTILTAWNKRVFLASSGCVIGSLELLFLLEDLFPENKVMQPIICLNFICLLDNIGEQMFS